MYSRNSIYNRLLEIQEQMEDIRALSVINHERMTIASTFDGEFEDVLRSGIDMLEMSLNMTKSLQCGDFYQTFIRGSDGCIVISNIETKGVLIALTTNRIKFALMFMDLKSIANEIATLWISDSE